VNKKQSLKTTVSHFLQLEIKLTFSELAVALLNRSYYVVMLFCWSYNTVNFMSFFRLLLCWMMLIRTSLKNIFQRIWLVLVASQWLQIVIV